MADQQLLDTNKQGVNKDLGQVEIRAYQEFAVQL